MLLKINYYLRTLFSSLDERNHGNLYNIHINVHFVNTFIIIYS